MFRAFSFLALVALAGLLACNSAEPEPGAPVSSAAPDAPSGTPPGGPRTDVGPHWGTCPKGFTSECAKLAVPLDHGAPDAATIDLFIAHRPAKESGGPAIWLLEGGPGGSGA